MKCNNHNQRQKKVQGIIPRHAQLLACILEIDVLAFSPKTIQIFKSFPMLDGATSGAMISVLMVFPQIVFLQLEQTDVSEMRMIGSFSKWDQMKCAIGSLHRSFQCTALLQKNCSTNIPNPASKQFNIQLKCGGFMNALQRRLRTNGRWNKRIILWNKRLEARMMLSILNL